jgi:hypothetical protein
MKNENFKPLFIGRDENKINEINSKWDQAIQQLNGIAEDWRNVFNEEISVTHVINILSTRKISDYLKTHFVLIADNPISEGVRNGIYKLEAVIPSFIFPEFDDLKNSIVNMNIWSEQQKFKAEIQDEIENLLVNDEFIFPASLKESITEKFTFYTKNETENKALEMIQSVCSALNSFNEIGISVLSRDLPRPLAECIQTTSGSRSYSDVGSGAAPANYKLPVLEPDPYIFEGETPTLLTQLIKNEN